MMVIKLMRTVWEKSSVSCETVNMTLNKKIILGLEVDDDRDAVLNL
jgi:hypothetical protein